MCVDIVYDRETAVQLGLKMLYDNQCKLVLRDGAVIVVVQEPEVKISNVIDKLESVYYLSKGLYKIGV